MPLFSHFLAIIFLREPQHTPCFAYPRHPRNHPQMKGIPNHKLLVGAKQGSVGKVLEYVFSPIWVGSTNQHPLRIWAWAFTAQNGFDDFPYINDRQLTGQIIATSHDLTPNGGLVREIPLFQGNLGWWKIIIWPEPFSKGLRTDHRRVYDLFGMVTEFTWPEIKRWVHVTNPTFGD